jgi:hypothetical protein
VAGGEWPKHLRLVAAAATAATSEQSIRVQLLTDIKAAFEGKDVWRDTRGLSGRAESR